MKLSERKKKILQMVVDDYIATAQPVPVTVYLNGVPYHWRKGGSRRWKFYKTIMVIT